MLSLLIENPNYTYSDLAEKIGKTRETIRVKLWKLENIGFIKRIGYFVMMHCIGLFEFNSMFNRRILHDLIFNYRSIVE